MPDATPNDRKRKLPPSFPSHLPETTVKRLKQNWVDTKKLKSKWRAEKKKAGLLTGANADPNEAQVTRTWGAPRASTATDGNVSEDSEDYAATNVVEAEEPAEEKLVPAAQPSSSKTRPIISRPHPLRANRNTKKPNQEKDVPAFKEDATEVSLREKEREAYSRSSLHTFRADPLHQRRGAAGSSSAPSSRGRGRGGSAGRSPRGRGAARGRGVGRPGARAPDIETRGQPDMRLRMNAMLGRIKRDYAS